MSNVDLVRKAANMRRHEFRIKIEKDGFVPPKFEYKKVKIKLGDIVSRGQCVDLYRPPALNRMYGRKNLCLKVFKEGVKYWGRNEIMGVSLISESTMVQNLMAIRGLAPRVYDVIEVNGKLAQVTDFLEGKPTTNNITDDRFKFHIAEVTQPHNQIDGKLVDFQGAVFRNFKEYKCQLLEKANNSTQYPKGAGGLYQSTPYHGGKRNTNKRLELYEFHDFKNKVVLDVGCNLGMMCRAAFKNGAKRVVGFDWPDLVSVSRELAISDGYFNLDFYGVDLRHMDWKKIVEMSGIDKYDIILFLAMEQSLGKPSWLSKCETLLFEGHGVKRPFFIRHKGRKILTKTICGVN